MNERTGRVINKIDVGCQIRFAVFALILATGPLLAQAAADPAKATQKPVTALWMTSAGGTKGFEITSVKQDKSGENDDQQSNFPLGPGDVYVPNGGVFSVQNMPVIRLIAFAYKITNSQWSSLDSQLPDWAHTDRYDIEARSDDRNATKDQMRLMVQSLLADRFHLAIHTETRTVPAFALVLAKPGKTGPQLQPHPTDDPCSTGPTSLEDGVFPCRGIAIMETHMPGDLRGGAHDVTMDQIASFLSDRGDGIDRPVLDRTGLSGRFDFTLEWATDRGGSGPGTADLQAGPQAPGIFQAVKEQMGLKLEPVKGPVDTLIIDHVERPSAN